MVYLEYLRARRVFVWFAAILIALAAFMSFGALLGNNVNFDATDASGSGSSSVHVHGLNSLGIIKVSIDALAGIGAFFAIAMAIALAGSLNRDTQNAHFLFVRPISRDRMALLTIGVDLAAIVIAQIFAFAIAVLTSLATLRSHAQLVWNADTFGVFLLGLGTATMWYGMLQLFSSWAVRRAGAFVGVGTAVFALSPALAKATFLGPLHYLFEYILFIDPLAYFTSVTVGDAGAVSFNSIVSLDSSIRLLLVWILAAVALAIATFNWKRVQI